ncbi:MAG: MBL fold metallo-hydrolase [Planctomycetota bacterium]
MFMRMVYDESLAQAAYLIGCQKSGEAIVIDPERDVDRYLSLAAANGLRLVAVAETHIHADFVSGARELAERVGAHVYVSDEGDDDWKYGWLGEKQGDGGYDHTLLHDGDVFRVGNIELRAVHTPGHTPEHLVYMVTDLGGGADLPVGMVSGDFVFVGDLGRPDLLETAAGYAGAMRPSAERLFHSVRKLNDVPDFVQIWPGHGAGSACGKALGGVPTSTVGYERRFSPALKAASDRDRFVDFILAGQPEPPLYFAHMKRINKCGPPILGKLSTPERLPPEQILGRSGPSVSVADTRDWDEFRAGHLPGSLSLPVEPSFSTNAGSLICETDEVFLVVAPGCLEDTVRRLLRIGIDKLSGWCAPEDLASMDASSLARIDEIDSDAAKEAMASGECAVLDVRRAAEFQTVRIPGTQNIAHTRLLARINEVPRGRPLIVHCQSGRRSARACSLLRREGFEVKNLAGGIAAWPHETESGG